MDYKQLKQLFSQHERKHPKTHLTAYITFSYFGSNAKADYPWKSRTYIVSSDNKAFQPDMGGYSIFGSCLNGTDVSVRLEHYMKEEHGGKDGWIVEECCIVGYLLIASSDLSTLSAELFYTYSDAVDNMLSQMADKGDLDAEQLKKDYSGICTLFEDGLYGADKNSAWLADQCENWHWNIQPVYVCSPIKMVFPNVDDNE